MDSVAAQGGLCRINPVTKTGQRLYMVHMLLLPFLPITALIMQNATTLSTLLTYQVLFQTSWQNCLDCSNKFNLNS